jgi:hypothetical protein
MTYQDWLLRTELDDSLAGRVWEYIWQWLFSGQEKICPANTVCHCNGYNLYFNEDLYKYYFQLRDEAHSLERQVSELAGSDPIQAQVESMK